MNLHSIEQEAADCRAAWRTKPRAKAGAHIHHETPFEALSEPIEARIAYILAHKPKEEQALRLRLMRPIAAPAWAEYEKAAAAAWAECKKVEAAALAAYMKAAAAARAEYKKAAAHRRYCPTPDCPWDGESIFGGAE